MTTELFGAPLLASAMVAYAWLFEAPRDAETIAAGSEVHHTPAWIRRFLTWALASIVVFGFVMPHTGTSVAACALVGYGAFTPVFRWRLNNLRSLKACYVSPSNAYDWLFIDLTLGWIVKGPARRKQAIEQHQHNYSSGLFPIYRRNIHIAGLIAYVVELASLSAGIWLYYHQL